MTKRKLETPSPEFERLSLLADTAFRINQMKSTEEVADFICRQIKTMIGPGIVGTTLLDESTTMASVKGLQGLDDARLISAGLKLAGTDPRQIQISINEISPEQLAIYNSGRLELVEGGFYTIFAHRYSRGVSYAIERLLNIRFVYAMGFLHNGRNIGGVAIFTASKDAVDANKAMIEIIVSHAAEVINRIRIEKIEEDSNTRYKLMFESAPIAINISEGTSITYANTAYLNMFGYENIDELKSVAPLELFAPEFRSRILNNIQRRSAGLPVPRSYEVECLRKNGSRFPILMHLATIKFADGPATVGFIQDITESKTAETDRRILEEKAHLSNRLAAVGEMAAGIAHEINNPLTSVLGFSELLLEENLPPDVHEQLKIIADGSNRVKDIIKRMLTFAGQTVPEKKDVNINELIEATLDLRGYVLRTANIEVIKQFEPDLPWMTLDAGQIQQVFLNLMVNAEYAMKQAHGKGTLIINTEKKGDSISVSFEDDGTGISEENKKKLFNPFFTTKPPGEGTGLGLSLSRSIVIEHGGTIDVESQSGHGARFIITLPINSVEKKPAADASGALTPSIEKAKLTRILVVDDEASIRSLVKEILTQNGYVVDTTGDSTEAFEKLGSINYQAVVMDIRMPGMSGMEQYQLIIDARPELAHKFIFMTGDVLDPNTQSFFEENKLSYIAKPFDQETLIQGVQKLI